MTYVFGGTLNLAQLQLLHQFRYILAVILPWYYIQRLKHPMSLCFYLSRLSLTLVTQRAGYHMLRCSVHTRVRV